MLFGKGLGCGVIVILGVVKGPCPLRMLTIGLGVLLSII